LETERGFIIYLVIPNQESQNEWEALKKEQWSRSGPISLFQEEAKMKSFELFCHFSLRTKLSDCTGLADSATQKTSRLGA